MSEPNYNDLHQRLIELIDGRVAVALEEHDSTVRIALEPSQFDPLLAALKGGTPGPKNRLRFSITDPVSGIIITGESPMALVMTDIQSVPIAVSGGLDAKNNPAPIKGPVNWGVSDATILTVTPATDGMSAQVGAAGALGTAQVNATDTGDPGSPAAT